MPSRKKPNRYKLPINAKDTIMHNQLILKTHVEDRNKLSPNTQPFKKVVSARNDERKSFNYNKIFIRNDVKK